MSSDTGFSDRMNYLVDLMLDPRNHHKSMKKLQWSAFRMYPMYSREALRWWMSSKVTMMAADWVNRREGIYALMDYYEEGEDEQDETRDEKNN